ncbi:hypothetical protein FQR65_LT02983 [Abscondita terminalis]|nr:hypothetical protein FQR65_LT02983 [Abscondita terminalis]
MDIQNTKKTASEQERDTLGPAQVEGVKQTIPGSLFSERKMHGVGNQTHASSAAFGRKSEKKLEVQHLQTTYLGSLDFIVATVQHQDPQPSKTTRKTTKSAQEKQGQEQTETPKTTKTIYRQYKESELEHDKKKPSRGDRQAVHSE